MQIQLFNDFHCFNNYFHQNNEYWKYRVNLITKKIKHAHYKWAVKCFNYNKLYKYNCSTCSKLNIFANCVMWHLMCIICHFFGSIEKRSFLSFSYYKIIFRLLLYLKKYLIILIKYIIYFTKRWYRSYEFNFLKRTIKYFTFQVQK